MEYSLTHPHSSPATLEQRRAAWGAERMQHEQLLALEMALIADITATEKK